jgi:hypothetical protein
VAHNKFYHTNKFGLPLGESVRPHPDGRADQPPKKKISPNPSLRPCGTQEGESTMIPLNRARRPDELRLTYRKITVNVVCMLLLQFPGSPLYILFFYLFLFFRKHKKNKKINILRGKIEYQMIVFNITNFNVGYHDVKYVRGERKRHIKNLIFYNGGVCASPENATFCTNLQ